MTGVPTEITHSVRRSLKSALIAGFIAVAVAIPVFMPQSPAIARAAPESFADLAEKLLAPGDREARVNVQAVYVQGANAAAKL